MAKKTNSGSDQPGLIARGKTFFEDVRAELSKVTWPSKEELKASTTVVMILLVIMAVTVFVLDKVSNFAVLQLLSLG